MGGGCCRRVKTPSVEELEAFLLKVKEARPERVYDPPQLKLASVLGGYPLWCDCFTHRSLLCATPPCCCAQLVRWTVCDLQVHRISEPERWFRRLLVARSPNCPEDLRGVWWMHDNNTNETLLTFQDADWTSPTFARKKGYFNWTHDPTCVGACMAHPWVRRCQEPMYFRLFGDDNRWVYIEERHFQAWAYVVQPGDDIRRPDGSRLSAMSGDLIRLTYNEDPLDPTSPQFFQYHVRRVAYLGDNDDELVLTPVYDELKRLALAPNHGGRKPASCGCACFGSVDELAAQWRLLSDEQLVPFAPTPSVQRIQPSIQPSGSPSLVCVSPKETTPSPC